MIEFVDSSGRIIRCVSKQSDNDLSGDETLLRLLKYVPDREFISMPVIVHNRTLTDEKNERAVKGRAGAGRSGGKIPAVGDQS